MKDTRPPARQNPQYEDIENFPPYDMGNTDIRNNAVAKVEVSERTLSIIALVFSVAAIVVSIWAITEMQRYERESRILQQQVMDQSALLLREGLRQPGDQTNGPAANLDYKRK